MNTLLFIPAHVYWLLPATPGWDNAIHSVDYRHIFVTGDIHFNADRYGISPPLTTTSRWNGDDQKRVVGS